MAKKQLVSIGDCTIDAFIKLSDASVHCDIHHQNCKLCISYADKVPYEDLNVVPAVGNSANVAVGAARLGHRVKFLSAVGKDDNGQAILDVFKQEKVDTGLVKINRGIATNYHFVLNFKGERTILVKHHHFAYFDVKDIGKAGWVFFSSLGENTLPLHQQMVRYLVDNPQTKMGFNPGTFQMKMGRSKIAGIYRHTYVLFVNREEAQRILELKNPDIPYLMDQLHKLGPKIVCITDGPAGAYASDKAGIYFMPIYPDPGPVVERTGAGDSFSSGFMSALMYDLPMVEALRWAPINSMSVVQSIGARAGLLTKVKLLSNLKRAPKKYKPKRIR